LMSIFAEPSKMTDHIHWSGTVYQNSEPAKIYFCYNPTHSTMVFGLPENGFIDLPVTDLRIDSNQKRIRAGLTIFGSDHSGDIDLNYDDNRLKGTLNWHGTPMDLDLKRDDAPQLGYTVEKVIFKSGDIELAGSVVIPEKKGSVAAVVFLPGSGPFTRYWAAYYAHNFAKLGYASFYFDKRGCGESKGNWITASLDDLADDAVAAMKYLASRKDIDAKQIGLWGVSQGGWVSSRVVTKTNVAFMIVNSGGGVLPYEEEMYSYEVALDRIGATPEQKNEARNLLHQYFNYLKSGLDREGLISEIKLAKSKPWFKAIQIDRVVPIEKDRKNWEWVATYDPVQDIRRIKAPVLLMFGSKDLDHPTLLAVEGWKKGLSLAENSTYDIKIFEAGHAIRKGVHGQFQGWPKFAPGYLETQLSWLQKRSKN